MSKINGKIRFDELVRSGLQNLGGELNFVTGSGIHIINGGTVEGDILLRNRSENENPINSINGSMFFSGASGVFIIQTKEKKYPAAQPVKLGMWYGASFTAASIIQLQYGGYDSTHGVPEIVAPWNGSIVYMTATTNTNVTAGSVTFKTQINGSVVSPQITVSSGRTAFMQQPKNINTFNKGDTISVRADTTAGFTPTTLDAVATIGVLFEVDI